MSYILPHFSIRATPEEEISALKEEIVKFAVWLDKVVADGNDGISFEGKNFLSVQADSRNS